MTFRWTPGLKGLNSPVTLEKIAFNKAKALKTDFFNNENIGKLERNKDSIKHMLTIIVPSNSEYKSPYISPSNYYHKSGTV